MIQEKIRRCALLLALQETNEVGIDSTILEKVLPEWREDIVALQNAVELPRFSGEFMACVSSL